MRCRTWTTTVAACLAAVLASSVLRGVWDEPSLDACNFVEEVWGNESSALACDVHQVATEDGFVLEVRRIWRPARPSRGPVLLVHGLADSSMTFVLSGPRDSLVGFLAQEDYEVWLLDQRGRSPYGHTRLDASSEEYWDCISLDEQIDHDIPAAVDHVRKTSGRSLRAIIGHSQGGLVSALALANRPEMAREVERLVVFGSPLGLWGGDFFVPRLPDSIAKASPVALFRGARALAGGFCSTRLTSRLCAYLLCAAAGCGDPWAYAPDVMARVFAYYPREASFKNMIHLAESDARRGVFRFGPEGEPHSLEGLRTPTALFYGKYDALLTPDAHRESERALPPETVKISNGSLPYGHAGYIWSTTAKILLYPAVVNFMETQV